MIKHQLLAEDQSQMLFLFGLSQRCMRKMRRVVCNRSGILVNKTAEMSVVASLGYLLSISCF